MTKITIENENGKYCAEIPRECMNIDEMLVMFMDVMKCAGYAFNLEDKFILADE